MGVSGEVTLRDVVDADVGVFYEHQRDPEAVRMAAFPARDADAHAAHWRKIVADDEVVVKTIVVAGEVAGNVLSWADGTSRKVGYWLGKEFWGRGVASAALAQFVDLVPERPLQAIVATHNKGSIRVLEKCGFVAVGGPVVAADGVEELFMELT